MDRNSVKMKILTILLCLLSGVVTSPNSTTDEPIVTTGLGKIKGKVLETRLGALFYGFRGIRYAKPPIGDLRFKNPVPIEQWNDIYDATEDGPMCPQPTQDSDDIAEDCLTLNVYTQDIETSTRSTKKPVIIFIHPGGFYSSSGQSKNFAGPQYLMDRDIVLVTFNYRLGSLGFMSTGTADAPGNAGFKDQVLVLKWVKLHITKFGGDPNIVTLMGYDAGAIGVTLHMVSPMSRGLFHRAIVMSGSATAQWKIPTDQLNIARRQARAVDCPDESVIELINCLKEKDAIELGNSLSKMFEFGNGQPIFVWLPVIEKDFGQERFLTESPIRSYRRGRFNRVPIIAGITKDEFAGPAIDIIQNPEFRTQMDTNFSAVAPICFLYERDTTRSNQISSELRKHFIDFPITDERALPGLAELFADSVIGFGVYRFVRLASLFTRVFYYRNSYIGQYSHVYYSNDKPYGTVHNDDLLYLFAVPSVAPIIKETDSDNLMIERMTRMWTTFATKGDPNKPNDEILKNIRWRPMIVTLENYLDIGSNLTMHDGGLYKTRYDFWKNLFPVNARQSKYDSDTFQDYIN